MLIVCLKDLLKFIEWTTHDILLQFLMTEYHALFYIILTRRSLMFSVLSYIGIWIINIDESSTCGDKIIWIGYHG